MYRLLISLICLFTGNYVFGAPFNPEALVNFLGADCLKHAEVSFNVVDLSTGKSCISWDEKHSLTPASTMKVITTATALDVLGGNFQYETEIVYDGEIRDSVLRGNIYVKGAGDPTLGSEYMEKGRTDFLRDWLNGVRRAGIKGVIGNVVVLDNLFGYEGVSPRWVLEDLGNYYAAGIYGVSVFDNLYRIYLQSFTPGKETTILRTDPEMPAVTFRNEIKSGVIDADSSAIFGLPFSSERRLYGSIPPRRATFMLKGDIPDPGLLLANCFIKYLRTSGVPVSGEATTYRLSSQTPAREQQLAVTRSEPLATIARVTNVKSNNHYAEHLYQHLKTVDGISIPDFWKKKQMDASALFMYDGSGLSPSNAVSAEFLTDILVYMSDNPAFYQSLPVAGKEGTVASFLKNTSLMGKVHLKSGSIANVQAYAGYVERGGQQRYAFAIIVNNFTGKRAVLRKHLERLLVGLFADN
ncbi:peptidase M15 [Bacteroidia bacterium]|nr:peptidase M15 [Bacteroidia bacterium]